MADDGSPDLNRHMAEEHEHFDRYAKIRALFAPEDPECTKA